MTSLRTWSDRPERNGLGDAFVRAIDYLKENPLTTAIGAAVFLAGAGLGFWIVARLGDKVIIYTASGSGAGEFRTVANRMGQQLGAAVYPANNAQDILNAIRRHRRISRLIFAGHGTTTQFLRPGRAGIRVGPDALPTWMSIETFAREVGPRMAADGVIGWAGCSAASNPGESGWSRASYGPGGENSFIGKIRDAMIGLTWWGVEHRGHSSPGHTTANPAARVCEVARAERGQPCESVMDEEWGEGSYETLHNAWVAQFQGAPSEAWISGEEVEVARVA
jgi:hypothetical protein